MRKIELPVIQLNDEDILPLYCDLYVLSKIQERMSLNQFERDIIGAVVKRDEGGNPKRDEDGHLQLVFGEYNVSTLIFGLMLMINEGLEIRAEQTGEEYEEVTEKELSRMCEVPLITVSNEVHKAFNRCYIIKKNQQEKKTTDRKKRTRRSTSTESS